jgi:hypothetical protein
MVTQHETLQEPAIDECVHATVRRVMPRKTSPASSRAAPYAITENLGTSSVKTERIGRQVAVKSQRGTILEHHWPVALPSCDSLTDALERPFADVGQSSVTSLAAGAARTHNHEHRRSFGAGHSLDLQAQQRAAWNKQQARQRAYFQQVEQHAEQKLIQQQVQPPRKPRIGAVVAGHRDRCERDTWSRRCCRDCCRVLWPPATALACQDRGGRPGRSGLRTRPCRRR